MVAKKARIGVSAIVGTAEGELLVGSSAAMRLRDSVAHQYAKKDNDTEA